MENNELEFWKDIPSTRGVYQASSAGRIRITVSRHNIQSGALIAQSPVRDGYLASAINTDNDKTTARTASVAGLVAEAFIGPRPDGHQINHIDGCIWNNSVDNLEYVTCFANIRHSIEVLGYTRKGELNPSASIVEADVLHIRHEVERGATYRGLAKHYKLSVPQVSRIARGLSWTEVGGPIVVGPKKGGRPKNADRGNLLL